MNEPKWILDEAVVTIHQMLIAEHGGMLGIYDMKLLQSALARPKQRLAYEPEATVFELAASYAFGLAKNHPFVDGNKRVALTISATFLEINGFSLEASEPEAVMIFEQLAAGQLTEDELAKWFKVASISNTTIIST
jgi:death-on-curing protein